MWSDFLGHRNWPIIFTFPNCVIWLEVRVFCFCFYFQFLLETKITCNSKIKKLRYRGFVEQLRFCNLRSLKYLSCFNWSQPITIVGKLVQQVASTRKIPFISCYSRRFLVPHIRVHCLVLTCGQKHWKFRTNIDWHLWLFISCTLNLELKVWLCFQGFQKWMCLYLEHRTVWWP